MTVDCDGTGFVTTVYPAGLRHSRRCDGCDRCRQRTAYVDYPSIPMNRVTERIVERLAERRAAPKRLIAVMGQSTGRFSTLMYLYCMGASNAH